MILDLIFRLALGLVFVFFHTIIIYSLAKRYKLGGGLANASIIAIIISVIYILISYLPRYEMLFFLGSTVVTLVMIKELYSIDWKKSLMFWGYWLIATLLLSVVIALLAIILF